MPYMLKCRLKEKRSEGGDVMTFVFETPPSVTWIAGQYTRLDIMTSVGIEERWFTISAAPYERDIAITTRMSGSRFKRALADMPVGRTVALAEPAGDFVWHDDGLHNLLIAGGIGVTPFISMLRQRHHDRRPLRAALLYLAGNAPDIAFRSELDTLAAAHPELSLTYVTHSGISYEELIKKAGTLSDRRVYVSGPEVMVEELGRQMRAAGLPPERLLQDWFSGYSMAA